MRLLIILLASVLSSFGEEKNVFYYFGYGSNLLSSRIHIQNPSAVFVTSAVLNNYRLDFIGFTERWNGAPATVVPDDGQVVWGALWLLDSDQMDNLDSQEGVDVGLYEAKNVTVRSKEKEYVARIYTTTQVPSKLTTPSYDRLPSKTYMEVIVDGAIESGLPADYVQYLKSIPHNGKLASRKILLQLNSSHCNV